MVCCSKLLRHLPALGNKSVASRLPPLHSRFHFSPIDSLISASRVGKQLFWFPVWSRRDRCLPDGRSQLEGRGDGELESSCLKCDGASRRLPRLPVCLNHAPARNRWRFRPNPARNPCKSTAPPSPFFSPLLRSDGAFLVCFFFCHRFA